MLQGRHQPHLSARAERTVGGGEQRAGTGQVTPGSADPPGRGGRRWMVDGNTSPLLISLSCHDAWTPAVGGLHCLENEAGAARPSEMEAAVAPAHSTRRRTRELCACMYII